MTSIAPDTDADDLFVARIDSPVGQLGLAVDSRGHVVRIEFLGHDPRRAAAHWEDILDDLSENGSITMDPSRTATVASQLHEYFAGRRKTFDLELAPRGTAFQREVWQRLVDIPFGETRSYGDVAATLGRPGAARAVGRANATNPIPIVIPCHRVIGSDGSLTGFGGGLDVKRHLLSLEGIRQPSQGTLPGLG